MTAMPTELLGLPRNRPLTRADLARMPDDGHRYELIDGVLIVSPAPRPVHQRAVLRLTIALHEAAPRDIEVLPAPLAVGLADDTELQPDIVVAPADDYSDRDLPTAPLLAGEVLSPSTRAYDLTLKRDRLRQAGCAHFWVVDPDEPTITTWRLAGSEYVETGRAVGDEQLVAEAPFAVRVVPRGLVER
jgi:Uma2 family endonuclease